MANLGCGCPGSMARVIEREETSATETTVKPRSELRQWPVQLHLVPPSAPYFRNADILISGSSGNSGESGSDLEKEVFVIPEAVGHSFDHLDLVIDAFEDSGVKGPEAVVEDSLEIAL